MNFKACTFERLALIFGVGRGAQVGKTSLLEVNLYGASVDVGRIHFLFGPIFGRRRSIFLQCEAKIVRRFDSTVKRLPKPRFEHVAFLFLVCFSNTSKQQFGFWKLGIKIHS